MWHSGLSQQLYHQHPTWVLVPVPATPLAIQLLVMLLGRQSRCLGPCIHVEDWRRVRDSWLRVHSSALFPRTFSDSSPDLYQWLQSQKARDR